MVTISRETGAQTEARLRDVFRQSAVDWVPGMWSFVEGDAAQADDALALIRDEGRLSALRPSSGTGEQFQVFRVVLPPAVDDSGFVGWLSSRVKAATGSGLFVICGYDKERGGVFDYYGVPDAAAEDVRRVIARLTANDSLDGVVMRPVRTGPESSIGPETVFCFDVDGDAVSAHYGGGHVAQGWLTGRLSPSELRFDYLQVHVDGVVESGRSVGEVSRLPDGRWRLVERFTRSSVGVLHLEEQ
jgi:hypothetical protein